MNTDKYSPVYLSDLASWGVRNNEDGKVDLVPDKEMARYNADTANQIESEIRAEEDTSEVCTDPDYVEETTALIYGDETPDSNPPLKAATPTPKGLYDLPIFGQFWAADGADLGR